MNTPRPSRNQSQTSINAETQRNVHPPQYCYGGRAEKRKVIKTSAALCESLRLCVKSSPPAGKSGYSGVEKRRLVPRTSVLASAATRSRTSIAREYHLLCFP